MSDRLNPEKLATVSDFDRRLKAADEPRWLASRYAPQRAREGLVALYLLNIELNRALAASEAMLGKIRLQWWREAVTALADTLEPRRHDLVIELDRLFAGSGPITAGMVELVDRFDDILDDHLHEGHSSSPDHMDRHLETGAALARIAGQVLDPDLSQAELDILSEAGRASIWTRLELPDEAERVGQLKQTTTGLRSALWPAIAHLADAQTGQVSNEVGPLRLRWRIFRSVLFRSL